MRKPRRLSLDELAPYLWEMPAARGQEPVQESGAREQGPGTRNQETIQELGKKTLSPRPLVPDSWPLAPEPVPGPWPLAPFLDWAALFGNANPVEVEVGMGKGLFLLTQATARPHVNFFGLEIVRKYQLYATTRVAIRRLPNARTACADAGWVFRRFVPPGSVSAVHVLFPDPWWKKRHRKRRVFTPGFAADAARALTPGGRIPRRLGCRGILRGDDRHPTDDAGVPRDAPGRGRRADDVRDELRAEGAGQRHPGLARGVRTDGRPGGVGPGRFAPG